MISVVAAGADRREEWDAFVASRSEADVLQSWAWGEAMRIAGQPPLRLVALDDKGAIRGVAQALVRPSQFGRTVLYTPHGPVWHRTADDGREALAGLLSGLRRAAATRRAIVVKADPAAVRDGDDDARTVTAVFLRSGLRRSRHDLQARTTLLVDLSGGPEAIAGRWSKEARNLARRSTKEGVVVEITRAPDRAALATAQQVLAETGARGRFRVHDAAFLRRLAEELAPGGGFFLANGRLGDRYLGTMIVARTGNRAAYLYGGSLRDEANRHANPGYGVMAAMMTALAVDGVRWLDLWGVHDPRDPEADESWLGFSAFKRRFGGRTLRHPGTFDLVISPGWYVLRDLREQLLTR